MSLSLVPRRVNGALVIEMGGKLTIDGENLRQIVQKSLQEGERRLVLKLSGVSYVDSAGLGQLITVYVTVKNVGGDVRLLSPSARARQLLGITKLDTVFTIIDDETAILEVP